MDHELAYIFTSDLQPSEGSDNSRSYYRQIKNLSGFGMELPVEEEVSYKATEYRGPGKPICTVGYSQSINS